MKTAKELKRSAGIRLNIKKPPKIEIPQNVYTRKAKHKKSLKHQISDFFYFLFYSFNLSSLFQLIASDKLYLYIHTHSHIQME